MLEMPSSVHWVTLLNCILETRFVALKTIFQSDGGFEIFCCIIAQTQTDMWLHPVASPAMQEIRKINNIWYLEKWEMFFSFAYLLAVWLLFGQNTIEIIVDRIFVLDFAKF